MQSQSHRGHGSIAGDNVGVGVGMVETHALDADETSHVSHVSASRSLQEELADVFDDAIASLDTAETKSPPRRFGDVMGIIQDQPLMQHVAETTQQLSDCAIRSVRDMQRSVMNHINAQHVDPEDIGTR